MHGMETSMLKINNKKKKLISSLGRVKRPLVATHV